MTRSIDLGSGPHRPFGSALSARLCGAVEMPELITVRPIRPRFIGPCPSCGDKYYGCPCEAADD